MVYPALLYITDLSVFLFFPYSGASGPDSVFVECRFLQGWSFVPVFAVVACWEQLAAVAVRVVFCPVLFPVPVVACSGWGPAVACRLLHFAAAGYLCPEAWSLRWPAPYPGSVFCRQVSPVSYCLIFRALSV